MTPQLRGTIIKTPDSTPGLLIVGGQQKTFTLAGAWNSEVAPAVNMAVDIEFDGAGSIRGLTVVDRQKEAREKLEKIGGVAQQHGREAAEIARHGIGALAARMGKVTLVATVILWLAWFFMPALSVHQIITSTCTFWQFLALDLSNQMLPLQLVVGSHGLLSILGLAAIAAPFGAPFVKHPRAKLLYAMPLAFLVLVAVAAVWNGSHAISEAGDMVKASVTYVPGNPQWNRQQAQPMQGVTDRLADTLLNDLSVGYGVFVIVIASLVLAVQVLRRPARASAGSVARPPTAGIVSSAGGLCMKCGMPLSAAGEFCIVCGTRNTPATAS
jgi:hypothetical protein